MRFTATVLQSGKSATGIPVPADVVDALGAGRRPAVTVTVNAFTYRTTVGVMGGQAMLPLSAERRAGSGVSAGDVVDVDIEVDDQPRELDVPDDVAAALDADLRAAAAFAALSRSAGQRHLLSVTGAKTAATRERRVAAMIAALTAP
jgi:hypothetical protein